MAKTIKVPVDVDKERSGVFEAYPSVPYSTLFAEGELYRKILGHDPNNAPQEARQAATMIAYLSSRVIMKTSPSWWQAIDGGMSMDEDDSDVLGTVYSKVVEAVNASKKAISDDAEKKAKILRDEAEEATK